MARWPRGLRYLSAPSAVERLLPLAVCGTDAQHQGRRPRHRAFSPGTFPAAMPHHAAERGTHLDSGHFRFLILATIPALSFFGVELLGQFRCHRWAAWQELLSRTDLSHGPGRRFGFVRTCGRPSTSRLAEAR